MNGEDIFASKLRAVTNKDKENLPVFSYSKLDTYKQCQMRYKFNYIDGKRTSDTSLALEFGSLLHKVLELDGQMILNGDGQVDFARLYDVLESGHVEKDEKTQENLLGAVDLSKKYFEEWYQPDNASGMNYDEKIQCFKNNVLPKEMHDDYWKPYLFEHHFEYVYDDRAIFHGFIDRIDRTDAQYRVIDYKTSKKAYDQSKLSTSLQFGFYALAVLFEFGVMPKEFIYRFVAIDETQYAMTKGWEKRLEKVIEKLLDNVEEKQQTGIYVPSPSPLCAWCNYSKTNVNAHEYKFDCEYHSNWTPQDRRNFSVNKKWNQLDVVIKDRTKIIF